MLKVFVATFVIALRTFFAVRPRRVVFSAVRAGRLAPDRAVIVRVVARVRLVVGRDADPERVAVVFVVVALRDAIVPSRGADIFWTDFARDDESAPRTAADDVPIDSAHATIKAINLFISVHIQVSKK